MKPDASAALAVRETVQQFLNATRTGNLDLFKKLAAKLGEGGKSLAETVADVKDANKRGALHFAAREGKTEVCKYLLEELKLEVDTRDEDGDTPLLHATRQEHSDTAKYLLDCGANPAASSDLGATALHHAAGTGNVDLLRLVLSKGVDVDSQSDAGTPLIWAAGHAQQVTVKLLLDHHADPNVETDDGITPLLSSVAACSFPCLELLIQAGANPNVSAGGVTPLHIAADSGNPEIINCLLKAGGDASVSDEEGLKAIQIAALRGNRVAVEALFPMTSPLQTVPNWSVDGIVEHMQSETGKEQGRVASLKDPNMLVNNSLHKQDSLEFVGEMASGLLIADTCAFIEVTPEAKKKSLEAKSRGEDAFKRKDYLMAVDAYTQLLEGCDISVRNISIENDKEDARIWRDDPQGVISGAMCSQYGMAFDLDPTNAVLLSNRSLCWYRLGQADQALSDAKACRELKPDWPKACFREGAALRLLQRFEDAANAFYDGVQLDPESKELVDAFREAVEAGRKFHGVKGSNTTD
ncbi:hypothetical protein GIB67_042346 [Kingdonia uniflora]|uniref:Uncharacterized protein n=1 Tax=Kingdonia uniflora TaxID=39325 RepID=A0A7J7LB00_9MAGN|nr:hypothetical protein GIB67_042346 [Kingdonia uniflora]